MCLQYLVIFHPVIFYKNVTFAKMKALRANTVWVYFQRMLLLHWQQFLSHHLFREIQGWELGGRGGKTDARSCTESLAEAGAAQMLLHIGRQERKQVSCFRHWWGNFLSHRFKDHGSHLCWSELPSIGLHSERKSPPSIPYRCTPHSEPWGSHCVVSLTHDFCSRGTLLGWAEKLLLPVLPFLSSDEWAPERWSDYIGISISCQFEILSNLRLSGMLYVFTGNITERGGEKVLLENLDLGWTGDQQTNTSGMLLFSSFQPFFPETWYREREREGRKSGIIHWSVWIIPTTCTDLCAKWTLVIYVK